MAIENAILNSLITYGPLGIFAGAAMWYIFKVNAKDMNALQARMDYISNSNQQLMSSVQDSIRQTAEVQKSMEVMSKGMMDAVQEMREQRLIYEKLLERIDREQESVNAR